MHNVHMPNSTSQLSPGQRVTLPSGRQAAVLRHVGAVVMVMPLVGTPRPMAVSRASLSASTALQWMPRIEVAS